MKKLLVSKLPVKSLFLFLSGVFLAAILFITARSDNFSSLSSQEMHQRIIKERDFAIQKAAKEGSYKCCIDPPCTMCYMEANEWNNQTAGTCACDELIAQGKDPCPQCERGLCSASKEGFCETESLK
ncbi:hypothetical protein ISS85_04745 [Candidatus Microgenomates bacterium]|nr:hypothetical protein [Candidatus Microgenomates bacterium]